MSSDMPGFQSLCDYFSNYFVLSKSSTSSKSIRWMLSPNKQEDYHSATDVILQVNISVCNLLRGSEKISKITYS